MTWPGFLNDHLIGNIGQYTPERSEFVFEVGIELLIYDAHSTAHRGAVPPSILCKTHGKKGLLMEQLSCSYTQPNFLVVVTKFLAVTTKSLVTTTKFMERLKVHMN